MLNDARGDQHDEHPFSAISDSRLRARQQQAQQMDMANAKVFSWLQQQVAWSADQPSSSLLQLADAAERLHPLSIPPATAPTAPTSANVQPDEDDDSSVDTTKYIISNRRRTAAPVNTAAARRLLRQWRNNYLRKRLRQQTAASSLLASSKVNAPIKSAAASNQLTPSASTSSAAPAERLQLPTSTLPVDTTTTATAAAAATRPARRHKYQTLRQLNARKRPFSYLTPSTSSSDAEQTSPQSLNARKRRRKCRRRAVRTEIVV